MTDFDFFSFCYGIPISKIEYRDKASHAAPVVDVRRGVERSDVIVKNVKNARFSLSPAALGAFSFSRIRISGDGREPARAATGECRVQASKNLY